MKFRTVSLLLALLLVQQAITSTTVEFVIEEEPEPELTCNNPMINMAKATKDSFYDFVLQAPIESESEVCKEEWGAYMTCCKPDRIEDLITKIVERRKARIEKFNNAIPKLEKLHLKRFKKIKAKVARSKKWILENEETIKDKERLAVVKTMLDGIEDKLAFFDPAEYKEAKAAFFKEVNQCFNYITKFRTDSLCKLCSGRSAEFFEGGKAVVSSKKCVQVVRECASTWSFVYQYMQNIKALKELLRMVRKPHEIMTPRPEIGPDSRSKSKVICQQLRGLMKMSKEEIEFNQDIGSICQDLLVIAGDNDDVEGDDTLVEEAVVEEEEEIKEEEKMPADELKKLEQEGEEIVVKRKKFVQAQCIEAKKEYDGLIVSSNAELKKADDYKKQMQDIANQVRGIREKSKKATSDYDRNRYRTELILKFVIIAKKRQMMINEIQRIKDSLMRVLIKCPDLAINNDKQIVNTLAKLDKIVEEANVGETLKQEETKETYGPFRQDIYNRIKVIEADVYKLRKMLKGGKHKHRKLATQELAKKHSSSSSKKHSSSAKYEYNAEEVQRLIVKIEADYKALMTRSRNYVNLNGQMLTHDQKKDLKKLFHKLFKAIHSYRKDTKKRHFRILGTVTTADGSIIVRSTPDKAVETSEGDKTPTSPTVKICLKSKMPIYLTSFVTMVSMLFAFNQF